MLFSVFVIASDKEERDLILEHYKETDNGFGFWDYYNDNPESKRFKGMLNGGEILTVRLIKDAMNSFGKISIILPWGIITRFGCFCSVNVPLVKEQFIEVINKADDNDLVWSLDFHG